MKGEIKMRAQDWGKKRRRHGRGKGVINGNKSMGWVQERSFVSVTKKQQSPSRSARTGTRSTLKSLDAAWEKREIKMQFCFIQVPVRSQKKKGRDMEQAGQFRCARRKRWGRRAAETDFRPKPLRREGEEYHESREKLK